MALTVKIPINQWKNYLNSPDFVSVRKSRDVTRKTFLSPFANVLTELIQALGVRCCLSIGSLSNWIGVKPVAHGIFNWSGKFKCRFPGCPSIFQAKLTGVENDSVVIEIKHNGIPNHGHRIEICRQIRGEERQLFGQQVRAEGVSNIRYRNICLNLSNPELKLPEKANTLRKIKFDHVHQDRISSNLIEDCVRSKELFDLFINEENHLGGFLQEISLSPFTLLWISQLQLDLWKEIKKSSPVWFFDATGDVLIDVKNSSTSTLFYSIVCHDFDKNVILPVAEFASTEQTISCIASRLVKINDIMEANRVEIAPFVCTDNSWALIGAVLKAFNGMNASQYVKWCFDVLVSNSTEPNINELRSVVRTRHLLCSTHYLKNYIKAIKKRKIRNDLVQAGIFAFTLLQDCKTMTQFEAYLLMIFDMFYNPQKEAAQLSFTAFTDELANRKLDRINVASLCADVESTANKSSVNMRFYPYVSLAKHEVKQPLKESSPFVAHFEKLLEEKQSTFGKNTSTSISHSLFAPEIFSLIRKRLFIMPLWSCVMIGDWQTYSGSLLPRRHLSNNSCESHFGHLKSHTLQKKAKSCSELMHLVYQRLKAEHHLYFSNPSKPSISSQQPTSRNRPKGLVENWRGKGQGAKRKRQQKGRVNPYINAHGICIYDQHDQHENQLQTVDFRALVESSELPAS